MTKRASKWLVRTRRGIAPCCVTNASARALVAARVVHRFAGMKHSTLMRLAVAFFALAVVAAMLGFTHLAGSASLSLQIASFALLALATVTLGLEVFVPDQDAVRHGTT